MAQKIAERYDYSLNVHGLKVQYFFLEVWSPDEHLVNLILKCALGNLSLISNWSLNLVNRFADAILKPGSVPINITLSKYLSLDRGEKYKEICRKNPS